MVKVTFLPSQIDTFFPNSSFRKGEKEVLAAHVCSYLAANGDQWETSVEVKPFMDHTKTASMPHPVYENPLGNPFMGRGFIAAIGAFEQDGFITVAEDRKSFKVTEKMVAFYADYVLIILEKADEPQS